MSTNTFDIADGKVDGRVRGLDTIRFFLALWVTIAHFWVPLGIDKSSLIGKVITAIYTNLVNGSAAVIVFFVISGFCIHYPYRHTKKLNLVPYFSRRHLRIWIPIAVAVACGMPLGVKFSLLERSILWSLLAEEIYYLIYPTLLHLKRKIGWQKILFVSYIGAALIFATNPAQIDYPSYGPYLTWLLGLPCWLLGCILAERSDNLRAAASRIEVNIWQWRFLAWLLSYVCILMNFHSPIKHGITLTLFAIFSFLWLQKEIIHYQVHPPQPLFENAGKGAYSIYLFHLIAPPLYQALNLPVFTPVVQWFVQLFFALILCYIFYLVVERPSHMLAIKVGESLSSKLAAVDSRKLKY
jgi:peptidoglycan/LPS O-acetylase OafA/YrhL